MERRMCQGGVLSLRKKLLDTFGAQVSSDHERYPADVKCLNFLYLYVGRYPRNNASRNTHSPRTFPRKSNSNCFP
ncbi:MAG: hypothetical protein BECKG1743F_GA0114225_108641 [Candidatus Kentron sp. G]|nr:MAG: hypothetical protein BECKG1743F_GA0114225_108641 [Candidatus Kentron sp. G]